MSLKFQDFKLFWVAIAAALGIVGLKYVMHELGWELIEPSSLHNAAVSSVIFVIGFLMSATILDYKESERMPADFTANVIDMYDDAAAIHENYPVFDLEGFKAQLHKITNGFSHDARRDTHDARKDIRGLTKYFSAMEKGKVPPNFVVKLKQQQTILLRHRQRINYIQEIRFIPSATILARSIVLMVLLILLTTDIEPFYGGLAISGLISFILVYMLVLINVISTPFHPEGRTRDDVSLFLIEEATDYLKPEGKRS
jgi:hypothetical protein